MQTIRGVLNGNTVELYDAPPIEGEAHVLITFLDGHMGTAAARDHRLSQVDEPLRPPHVYGQELRRHMASQYRRYTVGAIMTRDVVTVPSTASVMDALHLMRQRGTTSILVEPNDTGEWGIMTMRDLLRNIVVTSLSPDDIPVDRIATRPLILVGPDTALRDCAQRMLDSNVRRIVISENERPVGIISDTDIFQFVEQRGWGPEEAWAV